MSDTLKTALVGGVFALLGGVGGAAITGLLQVKLAEQEFYSDLVLKALDHTKPEARLESLKLLVETNLIKDDEVKAGVKNYASSKQEDPSTIPRIIGSRNLTLYGQRSLGLSKGVISGELSKSDSNRVEFSPPLIRGKRLLVSGDEEWSMFCREAGYANEDSENRETELIDCKAKEVEVSHYNYAYGDPDLQGYKTRTLSDKLVMCRNNTMEVVKKVVCYP